MERRAVDYVQPDVTKVGGITEEFRIAQYADEHSILFVPHGWNTAAESERETCSLAEATRNTRRQSPVVPNIPTEPAKANLLGMKHYRAGDHTGAFVTFSQAAVADDPAAQNNLGVCYFHGHGVEQRKDLALLWFQRAAVNGHTGALKNLARCHSQH